MAATVSLQATNKPPLFGVHGSTDEECIVFPGVGVVGGVHPKKTPVAEDNHGKNLCVRALAGADVGEDVAVAAEREKADFEDEFFIGGEDFAAILAAADATHSAADEAKEAAKRAEEAAEAADDAALKAIVRVSGYF